MYTPVPVPEQLDNEGDDGGGREPHHDGHDADQVEQGQLADEGRVGARVVVLEGAQVPQVALHGHHRVKLPLVDEAGGQDAENVPANVKDGFNFFSRTTVVELFSSLPYYRCGKSHVFVFIRF